jgi:hypothetical protein
MNAISVLIPYKYEGLWVFDDPSVGLLREPFVCGIDEYNHPSPSVPLPIEGRGKPEENACEYPGAFRPADGWLRGR